MKQVEVFRPLPDLLYQVRNWVRLGISCDLRDTVALECSFKIWLHGSFSFTQRHHVLDRGHGKLGLGKPRRPLVQGINRMKAFGHMPEGLHHIRHPGKMCISCDVQHTVALSYCFKIWLRGSFASTVKVTSPGAVGS